MGICSCHSAARAARKQRSALVTHYIWRAMRLNSEISDCELCRSDGSACRASAADTALLALQENNATT